MKSIKEREVDFNNALKHWKEFGDTKSYEEAWLIVFECCKAVSKRLLKVRISDDDFHDRLMDAVAVVARYIFKEGKVPTTTLSTFCYWPVLGSFYSIKNQKVDKELSWEYHLENGYDKPVNIIGEEVDEH